MRWPAGPPARPAQALEARGTASRAAGDGRFCVVRAVPLFDAGETRDRATAHPHQTPGAVRKSQKFWCAARPLTPRRRVCRSPRWPDPVPPAALRRWSALRRRRRDHHLPGVAGIVRSAGHGTRRRPDAGRPNAFTNDRWIRPAPWSLCPRRRYRAEDPTWISPPRACHDVRARHDARPFPPITFCLNPSPSRTSTVERKVEVKLPSECRI